MTILEFFKTVHPSVLAAKIIFRYLVEHYPTLKISDIAETTSGGTPSRGMPEYYNGNIPWIKSGELKDGLIKTCDEYISELGLKNSSAKLFPKGTLLVAMYGANIGKTGVLDFDAATNQAVCAIFPKVEISRDYLFWYFKQQRIDFIAIGKGGAQPNISQTVINNASIVVPKPEVQKKIVSFLERIEIGEAIDYNFFIPEVLKDVETIYKYKKSYVELSESFSHQLNLLSNLNQAILQEAVQGKLVPQDPNDEPASELIKRIKAEKTKSGKKEKPLPPIQPEEIPFEIPENWVWCRLGEICTKVTDGFHHTPKKLSEGKIYISATHIRDSGIKWDECLFISEIDRNDLYKKASPQKGEILITNRGAGCGTPVIIDIDDEFSFQNAALIGFNQELICNKYLFYFILKSRSEIMESFVNGGLQPMLSNVVLSTIPIPLPPLSEQKRIVAAIEKQFALTQQLKEKVLANQQSTEQLLKALLHQAFEVREVKEVNS